MVQILMAHETDLPAILDLQRLAYHENAMRYNDFRIPPLVQTLEELREESKSCVILKAVEEAGIIGSVRAFEKEGSCYIGKLIVHPDYQNRGIGRKLMKSIEEYFKATRYELFTGHLDEKNLAFYQKLGYRRYKEVKINENLRFIYLEKIIVSEG